MIVTSVATSDDFCLYLWRSEGAPGILYLARGVSSAETVYSALVDEGYIVKIVHMHTDIEYEMRDGALLPSRSAPNSALDGPRAAIEASRGTSRLTFAGAKTRSRS